MIGESSFWKQHLEAEHDTGRTENRAHDRSGAHVLCRGYEIVRILALKTGKTAEFFYAPALFDTNTELETMKKTESYEMIQKTWAGMDQAVISISNFPSYPDMGVKTIYGNRLTKEHAVGRILAYYFDRNGTVIRPEEDSVAQIPLERLKKVHVTAVCSCQVKPDALEGALRLRAIDTLVLPFSLARKITEENLLT